MPRSVRGVLHEFKEGTLHSGSVHGPKVTDRKQAIAIALSEQRQQGKSVPPPPHHGGRGASMHALKRAR